MQVAALALLLVSSAFAGLLVDNYGTAVATSTAGKAEIIAKHKLARSQVFPTFVAQQTLVWDQRLANEVGIYLNRCIWAHDAARTAGYPAGTSIGENIFASAPFSTAANYQVTALTNAYNSWYAEKVNHLPANPVNTACKAGTVCGHYTQVVWKATTKIGCAYVRCATTSGLTGTAWNNNYLVGCRYAPSGNFIGQKPYEGQDPLDTFAPGTLLVDGKVYYQDKNGNLFSNANDHFNWTIVVAGVVVVALVSMIVAVVIVRRRRSVVPQESAVELLA